MKKELGKSTLSDRWFALCMFVLRLALLNILWWLGTAAGLIIFGIGPATAAALAVLRQYIRGNHYYKSINILRMFWNEYREKFLQKALLGAGYAAIGAMLFVNFAAYQSFYLRVGFALTGFFYTVSLLYIGPVIVHFDCDSVIARLKASLIFGFTYLQYTLVMALMLAFAVVVVGMNYAAALLFGVSAILYVNMWFCNKVFNLAELKRHDGANEAQGKKEV